MSESILIRVKGEVPERADAGCAGYDLRASEDFFVEAKSRTFVKTDTAVELPQGVVGYVCSRSGLARNNGICVLNAPGVIDSSFRGQLGAILYNSSNVDFKGEAGMKIAQLVVAPHFIVSFMQVDELSETERGDKGFGSSGIR